MYICQIRYTNHGVEEVLSQFAIIYSKSACPTGTTSSTSTTTTPRSHPLSPSSPKRTTIRMISSISTIHLPATTNCPSSRPRTNRHHRKVPIIMTITRRSMRRSRRWRVRPRSSQRKASMSKFTMMRRCPSRPSADCHQSANSPPPRRTCR